ncbi:unnamed protein product [marine sediment metagenome]|uniref:Uncharacterized protein n=1 Tax=marine sediment metagenome TaxID=412755 RepID=X0SIK8_9ZZZZ
MINKLYAVTKLYDGYGYRNNDNKYIEPAFRTVVKFCYEIKPNMYITDYFFPEYMELRNDYIYYGFLILSKENVTALEEI